MEWLVKNACDCMNYGYGFHSFVKLNKDYDIPMSELKEAWAAARRIMEEF